MISKNIGGPKSENFSDRKVKTFLEIGFSIRANFSLNTDMHYSVRKVGLT